MKRILLFYIISLFPVLLFGQSGDGKTPGNAFYGTISSSVIWTYAYNNGVIYVGQTGNEDLTIGSGGSLSIQPGITVIFCKPGSDLLISGTGALTADGTSESKITFTRYYPTNTYWGHISFVSTASTSVLDNCVIEYGDVRNNSGSAKYGGGIYSDFSGLTISYCTIRNNYAEWGGGVFVGQNRSPNIKNCYFYGNYSKEGGGGVYLWNGASSLVENCIFEANHCVGTSYSYYTGGGLGSQSSGSNKVINCTFINNTSGRPEGKSLMFYSSVNDKAINCIFWGPGTHIYRTGTNSITYCAVQGAIPPGTGNILLSSINTDPTGPNFTSLTDKKWYINPWSPCANSGLDNSLDPDVPLLDFSDKQRAGQTDIGANESWGFYWVGDDISTPDVWNNTSNWYSNLVPSGNEDIYIPGGLVNYPTSSSSQNYTISSGRFMILAPGAKATFGSLTNSGTLKLESDASNISSLITTSFSGNDANVQLYLTGGYVRADPYFEGRWHYISSPFADPLSVAPFTAETYDLAQWVDGINSEGSIIPGWVAFDGYIYDFDDPGGPYTGTGFSTLLPGKGYNFWDNKLTNTYSLSGELNTDDVVVSLDFAGDPINQGFNLLGNPFPAGLDWDYIIENTTFPDSTGQGIYFTHENVQYSYVSGVAVPEFGTPTSSGVIPPMQGFFVKTYGSGNSITLTAAAQVHNAPARYKGSGSIPLVRLSLTEDSVSADQTVVRFDEKALATRDYNFDALKMFLSSSKTSIYSVLGSTKYSINGQPFPETFVEIPVVINLQNSGDHIIKALQIDGLDNYTVTLKDNNTGFTADLRSTPELSFFADAGTSAGRFILKVSNVLTASEELPVSAITFNVYPGNNMINIQTLSDDWDGKTGTVRIMDLSGRMVNETGNTEFRKGSLLQIPSPGANGMYIVDIRTSTKRYVGKVVVR